ncbi:hypothetical protein KFE25_001750 [Diacronema lutheri]|uniref:Exonuclease domain-containing protein n=1 Tax=Diacronema lutheri TaxID=2081491 RepID=A0A8J5XK96_DIALT|nr:hypothetical protein KFE25_001750 [Diacronema lutheri]
MVANRFALLGLSETEEETGETFVLRGAHASGRRQSARAAANGRAYAAARAPGSGNSDGDDHDDNGSAARDGGDRDGTLVCKASASDDASASDETSASDSSGVGISAQAARELARATLRASRASAGVTATAAAAAAATVHAAAAAAATGAHPRARVPRPFGYHSMLWLDLEMTGLDARADHILELACVLSDGALTRFVEGPDLVISQPAGVLEAMNEWCSKQHVESGLVDRVRASTLSVREAEAQVLAFVSAHAAPGVLNLAGNCVYKDKEFLEQHMPELMRALSWRVIDVSTIAELAYRWFPGPASRRPRKRNGHRAMADVYESIEELKFYRNAVFKPPPPLLASKKR